MGLAHLVPSLILSHTLRLAHALILTHALVTHVLLTTRLLPWHAIRLPNRLLRHLNSDSLHTRLHLHIIHATLLALPHRQHHHHAPLRADLNPHIGHHHSSLHHSLLHVASLVCKEDRLASLHVHGHRRRNLRNGAIALSEQHHPSRSLTIATLHLLQMMLWWHHEEASLALLVGF